METAADWATSTELPPEELRPYVNELALRIASFPPTAVAQEAVKR